MTLDNSWVWTICQTIPSAHGAGRQLVIDVQRELAEQGWTPHDAFGVRLALEEALVNAILHGNQGDERKQVEVVCKLGPRQLWIEVADEGTGFDPQHVPDCTLPENIEVPGGRGIMLMRTFMSRVEYNSAGNRVVMEKFRD